MLTFHKHPVLFNSLHSKVYNFQERFMKDLWNFLWSTWNPMWTTGGLPGPRWQSLVYIDGSPRFSQGIRISIISFVSF